MLRKLRLHFFPLGEKRMWLPILVRNLRLRSSSLVRVGLFLSSPPCTSRRITIQSGRWLLMKKCSFGKRLEPASSRLYSQAGNHPDCADSEPVEENTPATLETRRPTDGESESGEEEEKELTPAVKRYNCSGCGAVLQTTKPECRGYIPKDKLSEWTALVSDPGAILEAEGGRDHWAELESRMAAEREMMVEGGVLDEESDVEDYFPEDFDDEEEEKRDMSSLVCKRCFSLKHYNDALDVTLESDDYLKHLTALRDKRALIVLMLDVTDFPTCLFPNLKSLLSSQCSVLIVANKIDLFPSGLPNSFWSRFRDHIVEECAAASLDKSMIVGVRFISAMRGSGTVELAEEIVRNWGNRGDVYLLGCTNVGKSSLFNKLLVHLCGCQPGELNMDSNLLAPKATISQWPGTTLGLLSFPLMSVGKRRRLLEQQRRREEEIALGGQEFEDHFEGDDFSRLVQRFEDNDDDPVRRGPTGTGVRHLDPVETEDILEELGLRRRKRGIMESEQPPQNRFWLHDTPGAINHTQLINHLTNKELALALPKSPLKPKTFILKPGQSVFLGGLARLDYTEGPVSAYFTVFTWSFLSIHTTKTENADALYKRHLGQPDSLLKLPTSFETRGKRTFPPLAHQDISVSGLGWKQSAVDVVLSSAGWIAVTFGGQDKISLRAHTPNGLGIHVRRPALFTEAVNQRGKRDRRGNKTAFHGGSGRKR